MVLSEELEYIGAFPIVPKSIDFYSNKVNGARKSSFIEMLSHLKTVYVLFDLIMYSLSNQLLLLTQRRVSLCRAWNMGRPVSQTVILQMFTLEEELDMENGEEKLVHKVKVYSYNK